LRKQQPRIRDERPHTTSKQAAGGIEWLAYKLSYWKTVLKRLIAFQCANLLKQFENA
jgi:hypothetical protein